jgi:hypothetical protein
LELMRQEAVLVTPELRDAKLEVRPVLGVVEAELVLAEPVLVEPVLVEPKALVAELRPA